MGQKRLGFLLFVGGLVLAGARVAAAVSDELPVATGEYQILLVGKRIGEEQFHVYKDKKSYQVESTTTRYWPHPSQQRYAYKLDPSFQPDELTHNLKDGGKLVTVELRKKGKNWRSEVKGKEIKKVQQDMGERQNAEIDFGSPLFQWVTFRQLKLAAGERTGVEVVVLDGAGPTAQTVRRIKRTYTRLPDEEIPVEGQEPVTASVYEVTEAESSYRLWLDPSGFPMRSERETPEGPLEVRRVRFQMTPGAW